VWTSSGRARHPVAASFTSWRCNTYWRLYLVEKFKLFDCLDTVIYNDGVSIVRRLLKHASNWIWLRWETYTLKVVFVEHNPQFNVDVPQRSQIQFEDEGRAIYMSFCWVTTTCLRWEPQSVTLWLYPVVTIRLPDVTQLFMINS